MVFASLQPGTQAIKRSTSQIKFQTFSLGAKISTSFSNCKPIPLLTFFAIRSPLKAQANYSESSPRLLSPGEFNRKKGKRDGTVDEKRKKSCAGGVGRFFQLFAKVTLELPFNPLFNLTHSFTANSV